MQILIFEVGAVKDLVGQVRWEPLGAKRPEIRGEKKTHSDRATGNGIDLWRKYMRKCQF